MGKFIRNLSLFIASVPLLATKSGHGAMQKNDAITEPLLEPTPVPLKPLNSDMDNLFAGHSSHSSHSSHASHYSGSGGGGTYYVPSPAPAPYYPTVQPAPSKSFSRPDAASTNTKKLIPSTVNRFTDTTATDAESSAEQITLTDTEKLKLQIMRVQIKLKTLGLYEGSINGVRDTQTAQALEHFQTLKGLPETGLMSTATLNALGIPAAR